MMKFIILCPFGVRTGGPEALFQLSDSLVSNGFEAELWLVTNKDLEAIGGAVQHGRYLLNGTYKIDERVNPIHEYAHYKHKVFKEHSRGRPVTFVVPEVYTWMTPAFLNHQVLVWWLSVDNAFGSLSRHNLNFLRLPNCFHATQSAYAASFVQSLGLESSPLSDYTVIREESHSISERPFRVSINIGSKVIFNCDTLIERIRFECPNIEVVKISNLSREEVYNAFLTSRLFIDLGSFPGKDRMVREALALGANVILANNGSGRYYEDYPIPETYRVRPHNTNALLKLCTHMLNNPDSHSPSFHTARINIKEERNKFNKQVLQLFTKIS